MKKQRTLYFLTLISVFSIIFNTFLVNAALYINNDTYIKPTNTQDEAIGSPAITLSFPLYILDTPSNTNAHDVLFEITNKYGDVLCKSITDLEGFTYIGDIPAGTYYINIINSPIELVEEKHYSFTLDDTTNIRIHFYYESGAIIGPALIPSNLRTYDGNYFPSSLYEITDKDGNVIIRAMTNDKGNFYIPLDLFNFNEIYYFTLIMTPEEFSNYEMANTSFFISESSTEIEIILFPNNFKYKKGDLNKDGVVNSNDAAMALDLYNNNNATTNDIDIGDIDGNNIINSTDAALILDIYTSGT